MVYIITNGRIITEDSILDGQDLVIRDDRIEEIRPSGSGSVEGNGHEPPVVIDAEEGFIVPGFIDIHADYIEHMAAPRPTSLMDFHLGLREAERELVTHGITTMFHSLAIYDFTEFTTNPMRNPDNTRRLITLISQMHHAQHLIRHRFHARFEIDNLNRMEEVRGYIREGTVHLISFMDHTPGQGQYRDLELYRKTLKAYRRISDEEVVKLIEKSQGREKLTIEAIREMADLAREHGIAVASHDDDTVEKLELMKDVGASISEFPITLEVARAARAAGMHTVAGAPNILLGGSHSGNLSAAEAVLDGAVDILSSDYYPPSLIHAIFSMHRTHELDLPAMIRLVTSNPAKAVLLDHELGVIDPGKKADVLVLRELDDGFPAVTTAFVDGAHVFSSHYRR